MKIFRVILVACLLGLNTSILSYDLNSMTAQEGVAYSLLSVVLFSLVIALILLLGWVGFWKYYGVLGVLIVVAAHALMGYLLWSNYTLFDPNLIVGLVFFSVLSAAYGYVDKELFEKR